MAIRITRAHIDKAFTVALLVNSVLGVFSVIVFFLSSWWLFLILGTIGLPLIIGGIFLFKYTKFREPMKKYAINFVVKVYEGIVQKRSFLLRRIYNAICWFVPKDEWKHINWGYAPLTPKGDMNLKLEPHEEENIFYNQLYHHLATGMGNWNTLEGKNILEVRCGGGGGLNYLTKYLNANKTIGVDISSTQTEYLKKSYGDNPKMQFIPVDSLDELSKAEELKDQRVDIAISLQSSKYVSDFKKLVQEVNDVVRPGGIFSFADLRLAEDWEQLEKDLESSSMRILKKENITKNVMQALKLDELSKWQLINRRFGSMLKSLMHRIGVVKNNALTESLDSGTSQAFAYILHRLPERNVEMSY